MSEQKMVEAHSFDGPPISFTFNFFGVGPKWTIQCGSCRHTFIHRIPPDSHNPTIGCPNCRVVNILKLRTGLF